MVDTFFFFFLGSFVQLHCGERGMQQTNNTGVCTQCLRNAGPARARGAHHSGSTSLRRDPSEASPRLHALPRSKSLSFGAQVALEVQIRLGLCFVPFPGPSS